MLHRRSVAMALLLATAGVGRAITTQRGCSCLEATVDHVARLKWQGCGEQGWCDVAPGCQRAIEADPSEGYAGWDYCQASASSGNWPSYQSLEQLFAAATASATTAAHMLVQASASSDNWPSYQSLEQFFAAATASVTNAAHVLDASELRPRKHMATQIQSALSALARGDASMTAQLDAPSLVWLSIVALASATAIYAAVSKVLRMGTRHDPVHVGAAVLADGMSQDTPCKVDPVALGQQLKTPSPNKLNELLAEETPCKTPDETRARRRVLGSLSSSQLNASPSSASMIPVMASASKTTPKDRSPTAADRIRFGSQVAMQDFRAASSRSGLERVAQRVAAARARPRPTPPSTVSPRAGRSPPSRPPPPVPNSAGVSYEEAHRPKQELARTPLKQIVSPSWRPSAADTAAAIEAVKDNWARQAGDGHESPNWQAAGAEAGAAPADLRLYSDLNVKMLTVEMGKMQAPMLRAVLAYEAAHKNRKTVAAFGQRLLAAGGTLVEE